MASAGPPFVWVLLVLLQVLVDGVDVRDWNLRELRAQMGLVQQEPALFADSVR